MFNLVIEIKLLRIYFERLITGEGGIDGDGDITRPENISAFRNFVLDSTEGRGLHFLMADGVGHSLL